MLKIIDKFDNEDDCRFLAQRIYGDSISKEEIRSYIGMFVDIHGEKFLWLLIDGKEIFINAEKPTSKFSIIRYDNLWFKPWHGSRNEYGFILLLKDAKFPWPTN